MEHSGNVKIRILFRLPKTRLRYAERALRTLVSPQSTVLPCDSALCSARSRNEGNTRPVVAYFIRLYGSAKPSMKIL